MKEIILDHPISLELNNNINKRGSNNNQEEYQIRHSNEDFSNKNNSSNKSETYKEKDSKVYFYCPFNQTYTKFEDYNISLLCDLIKGYQLENYFIIQIDNDNFLYEEILKMQFTQQSQTINKMFDLKLDYSFSPFQDILFFNMSILTDFFYDQIEKYLIQIFFHNHGIYIINKDSCKNIHQILMEKFIFNFIPNCDFFPKSINDTKNKKKNTLMLINDFKLKRIIKRNNNNNENHKMSKKKFKNSLQYKSKNYSASLDDKNKWFNSRKYKKNSFFNKEDRNGKYFSQDKYKEKVNLLEKRSKSNLETNKNHNENLYIEENKLEKNAETKNLQNKNDNFYFPCESFSSDILFYKNPLNASKIQKYHFDKELKNIHKSKFLNKKENNMEVLIEEFNSSFSSSQSQDAKILDKSGMDVKLNKRKSSDKLDILQSRSSRKRVKNKDSNIEKKERAKSPLKNYNISRNNSYDSNKNGSDSFSQKSKYEQNIRKEKDNLYHFYRGDKEDNQNIDYKKRIMKTNDSRSISEENIDNNLNYNNNQISSANISLELLELRNKLNEVSTNNDNDNLIDTSKKDFYNKENLSAKDTEKQDKIRIPQVFEEENNINNSFLKEERKISKFDNKNKLKQKKLISKRINFSTDELIYYLFIFSLERLEEFTESLLKETDSLKGIYLELSEKERKDFFKRIHYMEVSMHIIFQETKIKKKFFKYSKNQFRSYNKLTNDFYFKNNFNFFLELMISKITQIELTFETMQSFLKMIKDNYHIIIEDNTEKENKKINYVMKVLTVLTTIYAPMNIIPGLWGMNVKVPWDGSESSSMSPFIVICCFLIFLIFIQLIAFKKWF